MDVQDVDAK
ncbi:hypothetical protein L195_g033446, partial [Trifolium pratense]